MSTHDDHAAHGEGKGHAHHVTPMPVYFAVFGALMVLTGITVWVAQFDFGAANTLVAMLVATIKASLVALIFMHLLYEERLNSVAFGFGLIFVALFFIFTLADVLTRGFIDPIQEHGVIEQQRVAALRVEYEKQFPPQGAAPAVVPGVGIPADERTERPLPPGAMPEPVPGVEGAVPGAEGAVPGAEGVLPGAEQAVPGVEGAVPGAEGAVPGAEGVVPGAEGAVPGAEGAVPVDGVIPPSGAAPGTAPGAAPAAGEVAAPAGQPADDDAEPVPGADVPGGAPPGTPAQPGNVPPVQQP
jgi:cytochrome c oxidase subunit 4